jgi:hypothetical protein
MISTLLVSFMWLRHPEVKNDFKIIVRSFGEYPPCLIISSFDCETPRPIPGNTNLGGKLSSTVDLLIKVACFVKKVLKIFSM